MPTFGHPARQKPVTANSRLNPNLLRQRTYIWQEPEKWWLTLCGIIVVRRNQQKGAKLGYKNVYGEFFI